MALLPNVTLPLSPPRDTFDLEAMRRRLDSLQNISTPNRPQGSERGTPYTGQTTRSSPDGCLPPLMDEELEESDAVGVPTALFDAFALQGLQHQMGQQQHQQQPPPQQQQQQPPPQQSQALQQLPLNCVPMVPKAKPQQNQAEPVQQFVQFVVPQQGQQNSQQQPQQQQQQNPQQQQQQQVQLLQQLEGHQPLSQQQQQNGQNPQQQQQQQQQQQNGQQNANSQQHSLQRLTPLPRESHTCTSPQAGALMYAPPRGANLRVSWRNRLWSNSTLLQARFGSALSNFFRANYSDRSPSSEPLLHNNYPSGSRVYFGGKVNISHCVCHHLVQIFEAFALTADGRPDPLGLQALWIAPSQSSGKVYGYAKFVDPRMATDAVGCLRMQSRPKTPLPGAPPPGTPPSDTAIHVLEQVGHCLVPSVPPHETSAGARGWSAKALGILRVLHTLSVRYRAAGNSAYIGGMPHHVVINAFMEVEAAAHAAFGQGIITAAMVDSLLFNAPCPYIAGTAPPREPVWLDEISMANEQRPGHAPRVTQHQHPLQHRLDGISIVLPGGGQQQQELAQKPAIGAGPPQQMDVAARQPSPSQQPQQQPTQQQQQQQHQQQQPHIHVHGFQTGSLQGTTPYQLPLNISITR